MTVRPKRVLAVLAIVSLAIVGGGAWWVRGHDQRPDPDFHPHVRSPAFPGGRGPRVVIDAAHHDFHTAGGRYAPFATLATADGFVVAEGHEPFTASSLRDVRVLVVANALGARWPFMSGASRPAFTDAETAAVESWVRGGGALLLVADHEPAGAAARALAARFGVQMSGGRTFDPAHADTASGSPSWLEFRRDDGTVRSHPVTDGRGGDERVSRVVSFTGQSLAGPPNSTPFLSLAAGARDLLPDGRMVSAAGRAQGIALWHGRGRVVVLGEAAMLTAQSTDFGRLRFGMSWPGTDDERLALNVLRWLGGVLQ